MAATHRLRTLLLLDLCEPPRYTGRVSAQSADVPFLFRPGRSFMDALQCILTRRSCRSYEDRPIPKKEILELLTVGTKAATGSDMQPWGFVTLEGREKIAALSDEIKAWLKENFADFPWLAQYREWLDNPNYNIFYDANNVICVYGDTTSHWYVYDGTLCTANIMLAAHAKGIGSCWIGFAQDFMDRPEIKARYKVPEQCRFVSALSLGYAKGHLPEAQRKEPVIFNG